MFFLDHPAEMIAFFAFGLGISSIIYLRLFNKKLTKLHQEHIDLSEHIKNIEKKLQ